MAGIDEFLKAFDMGYKMFPSAEEKRDKAEDKAWVREQRQMERDKFKYGIEDRAFDKETALFNRGIAAQGIELRRDAAAEATDERLYQHEQDAINEERKKTQAILDAANTMSAIDLRAAEARAKGLSAGGLDPAAVEGAAAIAARGATPPTTAPTSALPYSSEEARTQTFSTPATSAIDKNFSRGDIPTGKSLSLRTPAGAVEDAHSLVLKAATEAYGPLGAGAVPTNDTLTQARALLEGRGAAQVDQVKALMDRVRKEAPSGTSDEQIGMMAYGGLIQYYNSIGRPGDAVEPAKALLAYHQQAYNKYSAVAAAAAEKGDNEGAMKAAVKAWQQIPDGMTMSYKAQKDGAYEIKFTDGRTGAVVERHILPPDQIGATAMGLASPVNFIETLSRSAGLKEQGGSAAFKQAMKNQQEGIQQPDRVVTGGTGPTGEFERAVIPGKKVIPTRMDHNLYAKMETDGERKAYADMFPDVKPRTPEQINQLTGAVEEAMIAFTERAAAGKGVPEQYTEIMEQYGADISRIAANVTMDSTKNVSAADTIETLASLVYADPDKPISFAPPTVKQLENGMLEVRKGNQTPVVMREEDFNYLGEIWGRKVSVALDEIKNAGAGARDTSALWDEVKTNAGRVWDMVQPSAAIPANPSKEQTGPTSIGEWLSSLPFGDKTPGRYKSAIPVR